MFRRIISILFFFTFPLFSQNGLSFSLRGNTILNENQINTIIRVLPESATFNDITKFLTDTLQSFLRESGFYSPTIAVNPSSAEDSASGKYYVTVNDGEPCIIDTLEILVPDSIVRNIPLPDYSFILGRTFTKSRIETYIAGLLSEMQEYGYPFAEVHVSSVAFRDSFLIADIRLELKPGLFCRVNRIEIEGNTSTDEEVILRQIPVKVGDVYTFSKVQLIPQQLNKLRFFEPVSSPDFYINSKNEGILKITVREKNTNNFDGVLGFIPSQKKGESGYLTGLVTISMRNLLGTGRSAGFRWQKIDKLSQELELRYQEPYVLGYPVILGGAFFQKRQDSTYIQLKYEFSAEYIATDDISFIASASFESVIPSLREVPVFTVFSSDLITTGLSFKTDTRDDPYSSRRGLFFLTSYSFSTKKISGPAEYISPGLQVKNEIQRYGLSFRYFIETFKNQVFTASLYLRDTRGDLIEISDLYSLGGTTTLRGYRENQFLGQRIAWSNLEYRFLLDVRSYAFLFFDSGYFLQKEDVTRKIKENKGYPNGFGFGLTLQSGLGVISVSYALARGDALNEGKIHFGLINEF